jgi:hypothetical protein
MTHDAHIEKGNDPPLPAGLRQLWSGACEWVGWLVAVFAPAALRTTGLNREQGARLSLWLRNVEGAVRRLILAAALALTPSTPQPAAAATRNPRPTPVPRRAGFGVFALRGAGAVRGAQAAPQRTPRPYGHIPFPADPLLILGPAPARAQRSTATPPARNPLDRWGRLSRQDPDWRPPEEHAAGPEEDDSHLWFFAERVSPRRSARKPRMPHDPNTLPDSLWDWRRCHDEWRRLVPAPQLAARIEALERAIANPAAIIAGAARRLARPNNLGPRAVHHAFPDHRLPRRVRNKTGPGLTADLVDHCHDALARPDTS